MSNLRQILYGLALLASLALLLYGHQQSAKAQQAQLELAQERIATLQASTQRQAATINALATELEQQAQAQRQLQTTRAQQQLAYQQDQLTKQELTRHDQIHQSWAAQPLPTSAQRLHQRPAFTGAAAYRAWLSSRHALHPAPSSTDQQRAAQ